jgi:acetyl esterase/lipase
MNPKPLRFVFALFAAAVALRADPVPMKLWPATPPGDKGGLGPEHDTTGPRDNLIAGRPVVRTGDVSTPTLAVYRPKAGTDTHAAVLVCPGGAFYILAMDLEGTEVCDWLNSIGVTAVLLKYRVPAREGQPAWLAPLQDAQRAMGLIRLNAKAWGIEPNRVGALGFSAGGHLSAALSAHPVREYPAIDEADAQSCLPNFQILIYPGDIVANGPGLVVNPEAQVSSLTPPTFLVMAEDDPVRPENVLGYALALKESGVPMELHVYPSGGHGYGLRPTRDAVTTWPQRASDWMRLRGLLDRPN